MDLSALLERPSKPSAEVGIDRPCTVLLPTLGSAGDVHPVLAVARKLRARGHRPVVVTSSWFERACRDEGIEFEQLLPDAAFERAARDPDIWHPWRGFRVLARDVIVPAMRPLFEIVERRAEQTGDLVVASSVLCLGARLAHEKLGVPQVSMHVQPVVLRSREDRVGTPHLHFPRTGPRWQKDLAYAVADAAIIDPALCPELNAYRNWLGLPRVRRPFDGWIHSTQRVVGLWPDWYAPVQPDWPDNVTLTDFPLFDPGEDAPLDPAVQDFLGAGAPPVVFTGGSANVHMDELLRAGLRSCRASGRTRAVPAARARVPGTAARRIRGLRLHASGRAASALQGGGASRRESERRHACCAADCRRSSSRTATTSRTTRCGWRRSEPGPWFRRRNSTGNGSRPPCAAN